MEEGCPVFVGFVGMNVGWWVNPVWGEKRTNALLVVRNDQQGIEA